MHRILLVLVKLRIWKDVIFDWLAVSPRLLVVHYENVIENPIMELERIHDFLRIPMDKVRRFRWVLTFNEARMQE